MSGSTRIERNQRYYSIVLETPRISFAPKPFLAPGGVDTTEHDYHAKAASRFEKYLDEVVPLLDDFIESLIQEYNNQFHILPYNSTVTEIYDYEIEQKSVNLNKRCRRRILALWEKQITLTFSQCPTPEQFQKLSNK